MLGEYFEVYKRAELRMYEFSLLVLVYEKNHEYLEEIYNNNFIDFNTGIKYLESQGLVKQYGEKPTDIVLRMSGEMLFNKYFKKKKKKTNDAHVWFDAWRSLFPEGSNNIGFRYRGNRLEGLKKMVKFVDSYDFTKEDIFQATKNYVDKFAIRGYAYMQQAHFFIEKKDVGSTLASECESLSEQKSQTTSKEPGYGRGVR